MIGDGEAGDVGVGFGAGEDVPGWVLEKLDVVPETMSETSRRANAYENAVVNLLEAAVLAPRVGETFEAVVIEVDEKDERRGDITIADPAIEAVVTSERPLPLGAKGRVTLAAAAVATRRAKRQRVG